MDKERKKATMEKLRNSEAVYVIMSNCTRMPYVVCDSETYDDEVLVYYTERKTRRRQQRSFVQKISRCRLHR